MTAGYPHPVPDLSELIPRHYWPGEAEPRTHNEPAMPHETIGEDPVELSPVLLPEKEMVSVLAAAEWILVLSRTLHLCFNFFIVSRQCSQL